jgi:hypothetical protein
VNIPSKIDSRYESHNCTRVCQGDILRDFTYEQAYNKNIFSFKLPYLIVLTQDCDLQQDYNNHNDNSNNIQDKFLQSVLVCPAYHAEKLRDGTHLKELNLNMESFNSERWSIVKKNQNPRYHFLVGQDNPYQVPNLVIDFKHYYTIQRNIIYNELGNHYLATLNVLFRESLSQRFAYYLSRIGLPTIKQADTSEQIDDSSE